MDHQEWNTFSINDIIDSDDPSLRSASAFAQYVKRCGGSVDLDLPLERAYRDAQERCRSTPTVVEFDAFVALVNCMRAVDGVNAMQKLLETEKVKSKAAEVQIQFYKEQSNMKALMKDTRAALLRAEAKFNLRGMLESIEYLAKRDYGNSAKGLTRTNAYRLVFEKHPSLLEKAKQALIVRDAVVNEDDAAAALSTIYHDLCRKRHGTRSAEDYQRDNDVIDISRSLLSDAQANFLFDLGQEFSFPCRIVD